MSKIGNVIVRSISILVLGVTAVAAVSTTDADRAALSVAAEAEAGIAPMVADAHPATR